MPISSSVPDRIGSAPVTPARSSRIPNRTERAVRRVEAEIVEAGLTAWADAEIDRMESFALQEAISTATEVEFDFYDRFKHAAGNSAVKHELLSRKLEILSNTNSRRISRRFR